MGGITIRTLDGSPKFRLRTQAAVHGRFMEHEARDILRCVLNQQSQGPRLALSTGRVAGDERHSFATAFLLQSIENMLNSE